MRHVTQMLGTGQQGEHKAAHELLPLVYEELRRVAAYKMSQEPAHQTLQPTASVHEAWLRLVHSDAQSFENRQHFFAVAAQAMRRILIERARHRQCIRHGGQLATLCTGLPEVWSGVWSPDGRQVAVPQLRTGSPPRVCVA